MLNALHGVPAPPQGGVPAGSGFRRFKDLPRRRKFLAVVLAMAVVGVGTLAASSAETLFDGSQVGETGLIIKYKTNADVQELEERIEQIDDAEEVTEDQSGALRMKVVETTNEDRAAVERTLEADPNVEYVEEDVRVGGLALSWDGKAPNDPALEQQWTLSKGGIRDLWPKTVGKDGLLIGQVDLGFVTDHPEINGKFVNQYDTGDNDTSIEPPTGSVAQIGWHGSAVASVMAANTANGLGVAGGCWNCKIVPVKFTDRPDGTGPASSMAKALQYAADRGVRIINVSAGFPNRNQMVEDAVAYAQAKGAIVVAAAGNDSADKSSYPAASPGVISVTTANDADKLASYSNFGTTVDVAAPAHKAVIPDFSDKSGVKTTTLSGTSTAAPYVSALAALLISAFPQATNAQVVTAITKNTDACCDGKVSGRVNATKAYAYLVGVYGTPQPPVTPPTPPATPPVTPPVTPPTAPQTPDLNNDKKVTVSDLSILLSKWSSADSRADLNRNGKVDLTDLSTLLSGWGKTFN